MLETYSLQEAKIRISQEVRIRIFHQKPTMVSFICGSIILQSAHLYPSLNLYNVKKKKKKDK